MSYTPFTLLRITFRSVSKVIRIGLPSTLLRAIRSKTGTASRITFDPFSKRIKSDPDSYNPSANQCKRGNPYHFCYGITFDMDQKLYG